MLVENKDHMSSFSARDFRDALSSFATGVTIVTTRAENGDPIGMTASSFNSVSTDPPLILWSVTKTAHSAPSFKQAKNFSVHVLSTDQMDLSNKFAKSGSDKFADTEYQFDQHQVPIIGGCATRFDCSTWAVYEGGDHWIIVGEVHALDLNKKEGLVFGGGAYSIAAPLTTVDVENFVTDDIDAPIESMLFYHLSRAYHQMGHQFHQEVRNNGLTLGEWRISASLFGGATRTLAELAARTFLDPVSLMDIVKTMEEDGLCKLSDSEAGCTVTGTAKGTEQIKHLFDLSNQIESNAIDGATADEKEVLFKLLKRIVAKTEHVPLN